MRRSLMLAAATLCALAAQSAQAQQSTTPSPHGTLKEACADCHTSNAWTPARISKSFRHAPKTFPLDGAHAQTNCLACHKTLDFASTSSKCAVCHKDIHQGELGADCGRCHSPRSFIDRSVMVQQHQTTRFPLTGAHVLTDCLACHPPVLQGHMTFVGRQVECAACHLPAYQSTTNPPHASSGFPTTCESCHSTMAWSMGAFNHATTGFALTGAHLAVACNQCHKNNVFTKLSADCYSCHQPDFSGTTDPPHQTARFNTLCAACHSTVNWTSATYNHATTGWPLTGAHVPLDCKACHGDNVFAGKSTLCYSCHLPDYTSAGNPPHASAGFPTACEQCHTTTTWTGANFAHDQNWFPIYSGSHAGRWSTCADCHTNLAQPAVFSCTTGGCHSAAQTTPHHSGVRNYTYTPTSCYSCHPRGTSD